VSEALAETGAAQELAAAQDTSYAQAAAQFASALQRLAQGYEADPDLRCDLLQEIHVALWRSFAGFDGRCSLRTWVYRVAHNVAATHVTRQQRWSRRLCGLEELENLPSDSDPERINDRQQVLERLLELVRALKPLSRQVILLYLEGIDAAGIAEITGLSPGNVATQISRIKTLLAKRFQQGAA